MDRAILQQHLAQAERHVAQGRHHIAKQESLIAELDQDGHDTADARKVLATLQTSQRLHEQSFERILVELEQSDP
jgi:hypothetical protein